ncbi:flagellar basal body P-ring formation chaperone FlgA [Dyella ginsengisoli]|uniref:flagellar basal body P-ring formation chaperone FlgA n=1 Tax=Dyella ginsengisoli TaxID=363848 RepID=UPI00035D8255|nr:flagellar basal body P-ring formation chaperone FlgA [Dyella ginsengisoli]
MVRKNFFLLAVIPVAAFAGPQRTAATQDISGTRLAGVAEAALRALPLPAKTQLTLSVVGKPRDATVPAGAVRMRAGQPTGRWPRARVAVPVQLQINGRTVRTAVVWFAVHAEHSAWVYANDAAAGTPFTRINTRPGSIDLASSEDAPVQSLDRLAGERLSHRVQAGTPLVQGDFEVIPDVDRQQSVTVVVDSGAVRLQTRGTALTAGNAGQAVQVLARGADAPVTAEVMAKGVVHVGR